MANNFFLVGASIISLIAVLCAGCLGPNPEKPMTPPQLPTLITSLGNGGQHANVERIVVEANNRFALSLYSNLSKDTQYSDKPLFFSPFSLSSCLALTYEGAKGTTADEIKSVFFFPDNSTQQRLGYEQLYNDQKNSQYILKIVNALWAEKTYPFLPDYINVAQMYYHANTMNQDFKNQPENSRVTINTWVEDQTYNKIKDLIPIGSIDSSTLLVITNAIYFKGMWVKQLDKNETKDDIFTVEPGKTVHVQMMQKIDKNAVFKYTETDNMQVLEMPYATDNNKQVSMLVLLPKMNNLTVVEESLTLDQLSDLRNALISQRVNVMFPKFKLETRYSLPRTLSSMGMPTAFTNQADFSCMDGTRNLHIGDIIHQAFIDVNEEGTEAAAATAVVMKAGASANEPAVPVFRADHPFIFLIQDDDNGIILFMGRVNNPNG
jgi:serpin B